MGARLRALRHCIDDISLTDTTHSFSFSYDIEIVNSTNSVLTVAFVGTSKTIVTGTEYNWESTQYGVTTDTDATVAYRFKPATASDAFSNGKSISVQTNGTRYDLATASVGTLSISGRGAWSADDSQFVLSVRQDEGAIKTIALGETFDVTALTVGIDGGSVDNVDTSPTLSNLMLTATVPEPSAFGLLAGIGALALVAARRRRSRR